MFHGEPPRRREPSGGVTDFRGVDVPSLATECCYPTCSARSSEKFDLPMCDRHIVRVYRAVQGAMAATDASAPVPVVHRIRGDTTKFRAGEVYFIGFRDRIKIGFSTDVHARLQRVAHDRVLAVIPGTMATEKALHHRFAHLRVSGEWFEPGDDLMAYIAEVRAA